ncbi:MAG: hypothetical protein C3F06_11565 [Candidatus Methanoperedenaceae archaeon]|nr:MAG: hypothetical protein C3F06_11565 [Candidatus Methanoperedenaceae archaeon]
MTRIMIVDDKENDRYMLEVLLKGYGYEVTGAENGAQALEFARKDPPDVFISDIMMPVMDGFTLCRELKADKRLKTIPVIFYTATYTSQMDEELARNLGAREYIIKPQDPEALVAKLRKIMEERVPGENAQPPLGEEMEFFRQYNRILFQKLEKKMAEIQKAYDTALLEIIRRKLAEEILGESEEKYRTLIQKIQVAVVVQGSDTQILTSNSMAQELLGITENQTLRKEAIDPALHLFYEDGIEIPPEKYPANQVLATRQKLRNFIIRMHHPDKKDDVWVLINADPVFGKKDEITQVIVTFNDITELKKVGQALQISEEKFLKAFRCSPIALTLARVEDGVLVEANHAFEEITGYSVAEALGKTAIELNLFPKPDERPIETLKIKKQMRNIELHLRHKSGEPRTVQCSAELITIDKSEYILSTTEDITERKRAQESIRLMGLELQTIYDNTYTLFAYLDRDFNYIRVNLAYARADLKHPDFFIGKNHFKLYPHAENEAIFHRVVETGQPYRAYAKPFEYPDHPEWGVTYWDWTLVPVFDAEKTVTRLIYTLLNVTERELAQEELKKSESMLKRTQHLAKVGGWEYDIENKKISWSDEVYCIYGVSPEEYDPNDMKRDIQFYMLEDREAIGRAFNSAVNESIPYDLQVRFVNARGKNLWVRTMGQVDKKDGRPVRIFGNIMDITEMKNTQEKLSKLNEELEKRVKDRTAELETKNAELEHLNHVYVGRELRMIELKRINSELEIKIASLEKTGGN